MHDHVTFTYKNHRGEKELRRVKIQSIDYIPTPGYDYQPGWHLTGYDLDRLAVRSFRLSHIVLEHPTQFLRLEF